MKYLIVLMVIIYFIAFVITGCSPYRENGHKVHVTKVDEQKLVDYNYGDFDEAPSDNAELDNADNVYYVKYIHLTL